MSPAALYRCTVDACGMERRSTSGLQRLGTCRECGAGFMERVGPTIAELASDEATLRARGTEATLGAADELRARRERLAAAEGRS